MKHKSHASFPQFSEHSGAYQYASFTVKFCRAIKAGRSLGRSLAISRGSDEMTEAVQTAKNILKSLDDRISSDAAGRTDEELDLKHFTHEMSVLAQLSLNKNRKKMSQTAPIAQDILEKMEKLYLSKSTSFELDNIAYNAVANAWSKSGRKDAGLKIEKLLEHMEELSNDGFAKVKPCTITYNTAISAWVSSYFHGCSISSESGENCAYICDIVMRCLILLFLFELRQVVAKIMLFPTPRSYLRK